jgi:hypothetical protein
VFLKETQNPMEVQSVWIPWRMMSTFWMYTDSSLIEVFVLEEEVDPGAGVQGAVARARAVAVVEARAGAGAEAVSI